MADLSQTAANVKLMSNSSVSVGRAGEAITQGMPIYLLSGLYYQCDANDTAPKAECVGIALTPAATSGYFVFAPPGASVDLGATLTVGTTYILSATKGAICPAADLASASYSTILGTATAAGTMPFDPLVSGALKP